MRIRRKQLLQNAEFLRSWLDYKSAIPGRTKVLKSLAIRSASSKPLIERCLHLWATPGAEF